MTSISVPTPEEARQLMAKLGVDESLYSGGTLKVHSPIDGLALAQLPELTVAQARASVANAHTAFLAWRKVPAPRRGELVRLLGEELRAAKADLGRLVSIETGKILSEGEGEVQEMIDICDFATGLSRQLYGLTIATERPNHRMMETWHPVGPVAIISAFNFPVAVWAWNAAIALVCGDSLLWKPSEKAPLTALATQALLERAIQKFGEAPDPWAAQFYDAVGIVHAAVKANVNVANAEQIGAYTLSLTSDEKSYPGLLGNVHFDSTGEGIWPPIIGEITSSNPPRWKVLNR